MDTRTYNVIMRSLFSTIRFNYHKFFSKQNYAEKRVVEAKLVSDIKKLQGEDWYSRNNKSEAAEILRITSADSVNGHSTSSSKESMASNVLKDVHIPARLMEDFLELARDNTSKDLETCGVLGASLKEGTFYVTTLIIPKQESSSSSCQALNEEEIFAIQNEQSVYPIGWIHTHPSQSCFMSSVDLHTQYSYQVMVREAVAIVMAPTDKSRGSGVFRLSEPGGMSVLRECQENGYHPHREPTDGSSVYDHCSNVYINPCLRLEICDLR